MNRPLYSHHGFLFLFKWDIAAGVSLEERTDAGRFDELLNESDWIRHAGFRLDTLMQYNEFSYFFDFARDIMYDLHESPLNRENGSRQSVKKGNFIYHYKYQPTKERKSYYCIEINDQLTYRLEIENILLHIYSAGVGILSFHLQNCEFAQNAPDDILRINQFGRRTGVPFYDLDPETIGSKEASADADFVNGLWSETDALRGVQRKELPRAIYLEIEGFETNNYRENFQSSDEVRGIFKLPQYIAGLFPSSLTGGAAKKGSKINITPALDDKMFVVCWFGDDRLIADLCAKTSDPRAYQYLTSDWWYKYVFINHSMKSCQNDELSRELIQKSTNARWVNRERMYGVSRYGFVCLTRSLQTLKDERDNGAYVVAHVQGLYFRMVELVLLQSGCLQRFSDEVAILSNMNQSNLAEGVQHLYKQYIRFVNKIYFREVTAQELGMELYDLLQKQTRIEQNVTFLNGEIEQLYDYVALQEEKSRNRRLERLTILSGVFLPVSLFLSFMGMNYFGGDKGLYLNPTGQTVNTTSANLNSVHWALYVIVGWALCCLLGLYFYARGKNKNIDIFSKRKHS